MLPVDRGIFHRVVGMGSLGVGAAFHDTRDVALDTEPVVDLMDHMGAGDQAAKANRKYKTKWYRAFHRFGQANFAYGGSVLGSSQFTLLSQLPLKTMLLYLKVVKIDFKIIFSFP